MSDIFLVEDDKTIVDNLSEILRIEGFGVRCASGQTEAIDWLDKNSADLVLLDVSLSDGNGFSICSYIKENTSIPVIFLTASGDEYSTVTGLELGADDYISKPFRTRELISRIRAVLRRAGREEKILTVGDISVDIAKASVKKKGREVYLSALEYRLLLVFMYHENTVLSRDRLLDELWDMAGEFVEDNTLTVYIKRLRDKIEDDPAEPKLIHTVRGLGYKMEVRDD